MGNKKARAGSSDDYEVTQHDVNKAKGKQVIIDPEKGPENKGRKNK